MKDLLLSKGIILQSGEISKDKINLAAGDDYPAELVKSKSIENSKSRRASRWQVNGLHVEYGLII